MRAQAPLTLRGWWKRSRKIVLTAGLAAAAFAAFAAVHAARAAGPRPLGAMAMKQVVCKTIDDAKGKTGAELAQAIELEVERVMHSGYTLTALLPGDPPIACFNSRSDPEKLPRGAK